jgi:hypothetical protein
VCDLRKSVDALVCRWATSEQERFENVVNRGEWTQCDCRRILSNLSLKCVSLHGSLTA